MRCAILLAAILALPSSAQAADELPVVFEENFEKGADRWQPLDEKQWQIKKTDKGQV